MHITQVQRLSLSLIFALMAACYCLLLLGRCWHCCPVTGPVAGLQTEKIFESGDPIPDVVAETKGGKSVAIGSAIGMAVPLPGFVLVGAAAGGIAALPALQAKVSRYVADSVAWTIKIAAIRQEPSKTDRSPVGSEDEEEGTGEVVDAAGGGSGSLVQGRRKLVDLRLTKYFRGFAVETFSFAQGGFELRPPECPDSGPLGTLCLVQRLKRPEGVYICEDELVVVPPTPSSARSPGGGSGGDVGGGGRGTVEGGRRMTDYRLCERRRVLLGQVCIAETTRVYRYEPPPAEPAAEWTADSGSVPHDVLVPLA